MLEFDWMHRYIALLIGFNSWPIWITIIANTTIFKQWHFKCKHRSQWICYGYYSDSKTNSDQAVCAREAAIGRLGSNAEGFVACIAGRMMDRWWWTSIQCGKWQEAFPGKKGISYSCIVITFTVIHLRPTPRGKAHDTPVRESEMLSYQARWLSKSLKVQLPLFSFVFFSFQFNHFWGCVTLFASHLLMDLSHLGLLYYSWEYLHFCLVVKFYRKLKLYSINLTLFLMMAEGCAFRHNYF